LQLEIIVFASAKEKFVTIGTLFVTLVHFLVGHQTILQLY